MLKSGTVGKIYWISGGCALAVAMSLGGCSLQKNPTIAAITRTLSSTPANSPQRVSSANQILWNDFELGNYNMVVANQRVIQAFKINVLDRANFEDLGITGRAKQNVSIVTEFTAGLAPSDIPGTLKAVRQTYYAQNLPGYLALLNQTITDLGHIQGWLSMSTNLALNPVQILGPDGRVLTIAHRDAIKHGTIGARVEAIRERVESVFRAERDRVQVEMQKAQKAGA